MEGDLFFFSHWSVVIEQSICGGFVVANGIDIDP